MNAPPGVSKAQAERAELEARNLRSTARRGALLLGMCPDCAHDLDRDDGGVWLCCNPECPGPDGE